MSESKFRLLVAKAVVRILSRLQAGEADPSDLYFCYRLLLGRKPDPGGWEHWSEEVASGRTVDQLTSAFMVSREFQQKRPTRNNVLVELDGYVIYVDADDPPIAQSIAEHKTYEPHLSSALRRELKPEHVFLDIGCSIGWFTLLAASIAKSGKVIGVEPNHDNLQILYRSLTANRFGNVVIFPYAATDRRALLQLSGNAAYGFVHAPESENATYVQGIMVDELLKDEPRVDVIKMDIEGHEPVALRGMRETIGRHRPFIFTEFHPRCIRSVAEQEPAEYLETLMGMGYKLSVIDWSGGELAFATSAEVMGHWQEMNREQGSGDMTHVDILARPVETLR